MKEYIDILMNDYLKDESKLVNSNQNYYKKFVKEFPSYLYNYFDKNKYLIKSSTGAGQKNEIPWLCIFNKNVTSSATQGIYICFLFRKDMSGFYLVLGQGITTFENLYKKDKFENITKVADYFKNLINVENFSKEKIDLRSNNKIAKGYEYGTIISKYYDKNSYSEKKLLDDLMNLKTIYDNICENLIDESYMDIVNNVIHNMLPDYIFANEANKMIEQSILEESNLEEAEIVILRLVDIPKNNKKNKYSDIQKKTIKKIDYVQKAKSNARNGLLGEELVIAYEQNRLRNIGREDLAENIKWISKEDDTIGYDIISFDVDNNNNVQEKYIEVKTTESSSDKNVFYISANEVSVAEKLKEKYFIYRIFNIKKNPSVFVLNYSDFKDKIELSINSYMASIK